MNYYMPELIFRSIRQITHADWLLRGRVDLNSNNRKLGIFIQIFQTMECA